MVRAPGFDRIVDSAWKSGEPGIVFWTLRTRSTTTNPGHRWLGPVHFLDNVITVNKIPLAQTAKCRLARKIDLGVMGFADMLFQLSISSDGPSAGEVIRLYQHA